MSSGGDEQGSTPPVAGTPASGASPAAAAPEPGGAPAVATGAGAGASGPPPAGANPLSVLRQRDYHVVLVFAALVSIPISTLAYFFLKLVAVTQTSVFTDLPKALGFAGEPAWWPVPVVAVAGIPVALTLLYLPGAGGHSPADGLQAGTTEPISLPGIVLAAFATLALGVVLGPEAPLIAAGSGLGILAMRTLRRRRTPTGEVLVGAAGSFAALGTLLGSPVLAALFMMEAVGIGGPMLSLILLPGLAAVGIGALMFVGLGAWTGFGTLSLILPDLPPYSRPTAAQLGWALAVGLVAALAGVAVSRLARFVRDRVNRRLLLVTPLLGLCIGALALAFAEATGKPSSDLLFSGQYLIGPLILQSATWTVGALVVLVALKGLAYALSLSSFRGGPIFPALLLGAAGGVAAAHLPGMSLVPGVAMGMGAMCVAMLRLPVASIALPSLLLARDGLAVAPVVIIAVVVAYVVVNVVDPRPAPASPLAPQPAATQPPEPAQVRRSETLV